MLPLLLAFAQPLAAASASLRVASSMQAKPDVCFIHVGKTGGDSVAQMLMGSANDGSLASFMATHDDGTHPPQKSKTTNYCKWYGGLRPSKCEKKVREDKVDFHEQCGDCFLNQCNSTGHIVMWVRDPVSRLISIWNAGSSRTLAGKSEAALMAASDLGLPIGKDENGARVVDLGVALDILASRDDPVSEMYKLLSVNPHIRHDTNWFMGAEHENDVSTCKTLAKTLNFACVGRTERFADDWARCMSSGLALGKDKVAQQPEHTHHWELAGKTLSPKAVQLVRDAFANELECLGALHDNGHIPSDGWMEDILSPTKVYMY